jgi:hypothetical protein
LQNNGGFENEQTTEDSMKIQILTFKAAIIRTKTALEFEGRHLAGEIFFRSRVAATRKLSRIKTRERIPASIASGYSLSFEQVVLHLVSNLMS